MAPRSISLWISATFVLTGYVLSICMAQNKITRQEQEEYLRRYGYLGDDNPDPDPHMQELHDDPSRQFQLAIQTFQRFAGFNVTGLVDAATVHTMKMRRCGIPDIGLLLTSSILRPRSRDGAVWYDKWPKLHLTYRFYNYSPDLPRATIRSVFQKAFEMWSDVSALTFAETSGVPDIEIMFATGFHGDDNAFDGPGGAVAHAYSPGRGVGGDAHFDEDETWTVESYLGTNLLQVAVHELGHSLGLGHSDVQSAIMAPFYRGYKPNLRLHQDDIDKIRYLYGHSGSRGPPTTLESYPTTTPSFSTAPTPGNCPLTSFCRDFDAIDVIDNTIYAFKGAFYATLSHSGVIVEIRRIQERWPQLPASLDAVMATSRYVYFFKGSEYWRLDKINVIFEENAWVNKRISDGFPGIPDNVDAAFVWSGNGRVYFIKGAQYYRYRSRYGIDREFSLPFLLRYGIDPEYPKPLSDWKDVRRPVDDVLQYDGVTYFFSGTSYQEFDDSRLSASPPRSTKDVMKCCT